MIGTKGFRIISPHIQIGSFCNYLRTFVQFDQIAVIGDLLLPCGEISFPDEMYDRFIPAEQRRVGTVEVDIWRASVLSEFGAHVVEDDSLFAIFSRIGKVVGVYSIWDNSIVEVYLDKGVDLKMLHPFEIEETEFPGAHATCDKFVNNRVLPLIRSVLMGESELAFPLSNKVTRPAR